MILLTEIFRRRRYKTVLSTWLVGRGRWARTRGGSPMSSGWKHAVLIQLLRWGRRQPRGRHGRVVTELLFRLRRQELREEPGGATRCRAHVMVARTRTCSSPSRGSRGEDVAVVQKGQGSGRGGGRCAHERRETGRGGQEGRLEAAGAAPVPETGRTSKKIIHRDTSLPWDQWLDRKRREIVLALPTLLLSMSLTNFIILIVQLTSWFRTLLILRIFRLLLLALVSPSRQQVTVFILSRRVGTVASQSCSRGRRWRRLRWRGQQARWRVATARRRLFLLAHGHWKNASVFHFFPSLFSFPCFFHRFLTWFWNQININ